MRSLRNIPALILSLVLNAQYARADVFASGDTPGAMLFTDFVVNGVTKPRSHCRSEMSKLLREDVRQSFYASLRHVAVPEVVDIVLCQLEALLEAATEQGVFWPVKTIVNQLAPDQVPVEPKSWRMATHCQRKPDRALLPYPNLQIVGYAEANMVYLCDAYRKLTALQQSAALMHLMLDLLNVKSTRLGDVNAFLFAEEEWQRDELLAFAEELKTPQIRPHYNILITELGSTSRALDIAGAAKPSHTEVCFGRGVTEAQEEAYVIWSVDLRGAERCRDKRFFSLHRDIAMRLDDNPHTRDNGRSLRSELGFTAAAFEPQSLQLTKVCGSDADGTLLPSCDVMFLGGRLKVVVRPWVMAEVSEQSRRHIDKTPLQIFSRTELSESHQRLSAPKGSYTAENGDEMYIHGLTPHPSIPGLSELFIAKSYKETDLVIPSRYYCLGSGLCRESSSRFREQDLRLGQRSFLYQNQAPENSSRYYWSG